MVDKRKFVYRAVIGCGILLGLVALGSLILTLLGIGG